MLGVKCVRGSSIWRVSPRKKDTCGADLWNRDGFFGEEYSVVWPNEGLCWGVQAKLLHPQLWLSQPSKCIHGEVHTFNCFDIWRQLTWAAITWAKLIPAFPLFKELLVLFPGASSPRGWNTACLDVRTVVGFLSPGGCILLWLALFRHYPAAGTECYHRCGSESQSHALVFSFPEQRTGAGTEPTTKCMQKKSK